MKKAVCSCHTTYHDRRPCLEERVEEVVDDRGAIIPQRLHVQIIVFCDDLHIVSLQLQSLSIHQLLRPRGWSRRRG